MNPRVEPIRQRYGHYRNAVPRSCVSDLNILLDEVDRLTKAFMDLTEANKVLRAELDKYKGEA